MSTKSIIDQYFQIKQQYPLFIVLFRIGHFYEIFGDDVECISSILKLRITAKKQVPMCGFPQSALYNHLVTLLDHRFKIIICEESQNKESRNSLIKRYIARILTPGTIIDLDLMRNTDSNFILSCHEYANQYYCAISDISTGEIYLGTGDIVYLRQLIDTWAPVEIVAPDVLCPGLQNIINTSRHVGKVCLSNLNIHQHANEAHFLCTTSNDIEALTIKSLMNYVASIYDSSQPTHMKIITPLHAENAMHMHYFTVQNLEIFNNIQGDHKRSIFSVLNQTVTSGGARLLRRRLLQPLKSVDEINTRLNNIEKVRDHYINLRAILMQLDDIQRAVGRISFGRHHAKDLLICIDTFKSIRDIVHIMQQCDYTTTASIDFLNEIYEFGLHLESMIIRDDIPHIKPSYSDVLNNLHTNRENIIQCALNIVHRYKKELSIDDLSLEIQYKQLRIKASEEAYMSIPYSFKKLSNDQSYTYYTTDEICVLSDDFASICDKIASEEAKALSHIFDEVIVKCHDILDISCILADLDVTCALAKFSYERQCVRPTVTNKNVFDVVNGKHLLIESAMGNCVANNCNMDDARIMLMLGPNMSGKTTFAKQNAIIAYLSHVGCFVPAESANIGIIDQLFVRVGANDDLSNGFSTFMVEMHELGAILRTATERSFIIIDEIGRGTCSKAGEAIARSAVEHLSHLNCRAIFTTHYSSLATIPNTHSYHLETYSDHHEINFLYKIQPGAHSESYAIAVARKAGIPECVLERVSCLLNKDINP